MQNIPLTIYSHMVAVCDEKIAHKGRDVGLSLYAFFKNKNDNPVLLQAVATWWITEQKFDHFEKAVKIKKCIERLNT